MKHILATLATAILASSPAFAQAGEVEERKIGGNTGNARDYLIQNLTPKELAKLQNQQTAGNATSIVQTGNSNIAIIQQVGMGNVTDLTQDGDRNTYESIIEGNNNLLLINQRGNDNTIVHEVKADDHQFKIRQMGNGNVLRQSEIGTIQAVPVEITQQGQGMQISITNGRIN